MGRTRILFAYTHTDAPWGGANNFIRGLFRALSAEQDFELSHDPSQPFDILFMNQLGKGPGNGGVPWRLEEIDALRRRNPAARLVVRAINLRAHSHPQAGWRGWWDNRRRDRDSLALLRRADHVIFQSAYQESVFEAAGARPRARTIIHNGADPLFAAVPGPARLTDGAPLHFLCSVMGPRKTKRHDLVAALSRLEGTRVDYAGAWPADIDPAAVRMLGTLTHESLAQRLSDTHYFLHPALRDPCPNAMIEALNAGVPVIYNPGPGSGAELAGDCGLALDERDLSRTVHAARARHAALCTRAGASRSAHGMARAAAAYAQILRSVEERSP